MTFTTSEDPRLHTLGALPPLRSKPDLPEPAARRPLSVLLIDPSPLTRECLGLALADRVHDLSVVTAGSLDQARLGAPVDVVLLHAGALETEPVARELSALSAALPDVPVVILAARQSPGDVLNALKMGVRGYLSHDVGPHELSLALRRISGGEVFVPAAALGGPGEVDRERGAPPPAPDPAHPALTPRQSDVLVRIRQGKSNKIIAFELGMQESTVKVHVRNILKQLGATNRTEAVYLADLR